MYWIEREFEKEATEEARWLIYVARRRGGIDNVGEVLTGFRENINPARGGVIMEVRSDRYVCDYGEFYRIRVRRLIDLNIISGNFLFHRRKPRREGFCRELKEWELLSSVFQVAVCYETKRVRFGPTGNLGMLPEEDKGSGVGRYCFSKVIKWTLDRYPEYKVAEGSLSAVDARSHSARERRNRLYQGAGFTLRYTDNNREEGAFFADKVSSLSAWWRKNQIREISFYGISGIVEKVVGEKESLLKRGLACDDQLERMAKTRDLWRGCSLYALLSILGLVFFWFFFGSYK